MYEFTEATWSECPPYDAGIVDAVLSKYCTIQEVTAENRPTKKAGIDISKRRDAIVNTLARNNKPIQIFGELELNMLKDQAISSRTIF